MNIIRIFQHLDCEGPAHLQALLEARQVPFELVRIDRYEPVNLQLDHVAGLIFMGGPMSVNDPLDWIAQEIAMIQSAVQQNIPILGICLGSQLLARALGARVYAGPCMEIGWYPVNCIPNHPLTAGLPERMEVFHWHGETFDLPDDAHLLFSNEHYDHQGFAVGPHLGLQFHVEMQADLVREWIRRNPADLERRCEHEHDTDAILQDLDEHITALQQLAHTLLDNWLLNCRLD